MKITDLKGVKSKCLLFYHLQIESPIKHRITVMNRLEEDGWNITGELPGTKSSTSIIIAQKQQSRSPKEQ